MRVTLASHPSAARAGIHGIIMTVTRRPGAGGAGGIVALRLHYSSFARDYGGAWASRLRIVELPACALSAPSLAVCREESPLKSANNPLTGTVSATVRFPADPAAAGPLPSVPGSSAGETPLLTSPAVSPAVVLAATSGPSGDQGDYTATPLSAAGTWAAQDGDFTYSYPISVPPALGGAAPHVSLGYDSQSIDAETSGKNTQSSWIGDGWDYSPGFIERSYEPCSQDGITNSGDECWGGYNATLSLDGHSDVLVRDDSTGGWHLQSDDGAKVQLLTGASNGLWNGEYWLITDPRRDEVLLRRRITCPAAADQTRRPTRPGACRSTARAAADPCHQHAWCQMGWRWNLDYVVDPHSNLTVYDYAPRPTTTAGAAARTRIGTLTPYVRAGYPAVHLLRLQLPDAIAGNKPAAQVLFGVLAALPAARPPRARRTPT